MAQFMNVIMNKFSLDTWLDLLYDKWIIMNIWADECMNVWLMNEWMYGWWMNECLTDETMGECMINEWMYGWWMNKYLAGEMDEYLADEWMNVGW